MWRKFFIFFVILIAGCKKQNHPVKPPEWPRSGIGGIVRDTVSGDALEGVELHLKILRLLYKADTVEPYPESTVTDSSGFYFFSNIPLGHGVITALKEGYSPRSKEFVLFYDERYDFDILLQRYTPRAKKFTLFSWDRDIFDIVLPPLNFNDSLLIYARPSD